MALAAAEVQHHPSRELQLVGITGTNGKTTTAYLIASIPEEAGELVAMTGTVEYRLGKERFKADRTTPEAPDMQRLLRRAVEIGCRTAVMECSSQAMDFHRCDELEYAVAVFSKSHARPSRLPQDDGELLVRETATVRRSSRNASTEFGHQYRRSVRCRAGNVTREGWFARHSLRG